MPTFNRVDMLNCAAGHHDFSDDASECRVCGLSDLDASIPAPADPVRDAAPDMLAALGTALGLITKHGLAVELAKSHPEDFARLEAARTVNEKARGAA